MPCPICNDCEGWESPARAKDERPGTRRPKPFHVKSELDALVRSAKSGCITCFIFCKAVNHFFPEARGDEELEGWLPIQPHLPNLVLKSNGPDIYKDGRFIQFYTASSNVKSLFLGLECFVPSIHMLHKVSRYYLLQCSMQWG
jgi:hypothetical protein